VDGAAWLGEPALLAEGERPVGDGYYNLGVAHGIAGVQAFLGFAGRTVPEARELQRRSRTWMRQHRAPGFPAYPCLVGVDDPRNRQLRSGWCHGDPGLAAAWFSAAKAAGDEAWAEEALQIARALAGRSSQELGVTDAGLCHGAAGLAHLFLRLQRRTGESVFAQESAIWFGRTLELRRREGGVGGFVAAGANGDSADPGFLAGAAGIGLALLAAVGRAEPAWDRVLLVSHYG
jgi:lantibiotic modifying enzyme